MINKSLVTNLVALITTFIGYFTHEAIFITGIFALSGSLTNYLAIYMLFERIPFLYGSGVIPNRFEDFKSGIKSLIIEEFFSKEHIEKFFQENGQSLNIAKNIKDKIDFNKVFEGLTDSITKSSLGSMLAMVGGKQALEPLRDPVIEKLQTIIVELADNNISQDNGNEFVDSLISKIENIIDNRLKDLTPDMVKNIIHKMIQKHLGWLVVWGGVFGGLIGFIFSFL